MKVKLYYKSNGKKRYFYRQAFMRPTIEPCKALCFQKLWCQFFAVKHYPKRKTGNFYSCYLFDNNRTIGLGTHKNIEIFRKNN